MESTSASTCSSRQLEPRRTSWPPSFQVSEPESRDDSDEGGPKRHSWPELSPSRSNDETEDPETAHSRRRSSLCQSLAQLSLDTGRQCIDINDRLENVSPQAREEATEVLSSLTQLSALLRLELDTLRASARGFSIHRFSSFWIKSWKIVYESRQRLLETGRLLEQLDADHHFRQIGGEEDGEGHRLEGFRLQAFVDEVEQARQKYARTSKETREVNRFAFAEQKKTASG